ncbi:MAG: prolyl oligopeptidase family serine peptidase [Bacteroidota bacterium]|nr:prolyl oligopeptidase family serine peptidase [Bacteroidota bacterium]
MNKIFSLIIIAAIIVMSGCKEEKTGLMYPVTNKVEQADDYFGTSVEDPYRWLEDDNSAETADWVKAENTVTEAYLAEIPFRDQLRDRLTKIWNYPKFGVPYKEGKHYLYYKNDGLQNQSVLYIQEGIDGEPRVLLDPNELSEDGTVALSGTDISKDGKYMAYKIARAGSDWNEIFVMDMESGALLEDHIEWVKFSGISWKDDGFYYGSYDQPEEGEELSDKNENHKVYYHKIGTAQKEDVLVYENPEFPLRNHYCGTTEDERFLLLYESESTSGNSLYFKDLHKKKAEFTLLAEGFDYDYGVIDNLGHMLLILTNDGAAKNKLILVDTRKPGKENWKVIIPEKEEVLDGVSLIGGHIMAEYMKDAHSIAQIYSIKGEYLKDIALPTIGTLAGFSSEKDEDIAFYGFTSFTFPTAVYRFDLKENKSTEYRRAQIDIDASAYTTEQVFFTSKDGTRIPMFIVHKKGLEMNADNPAMLYGYGGFDISITPSFNVSRLVFLENGGIFAIANIRGGGEYGEEWHKAGIKLQKQNVFDDFIAAAEYLISNKYTSSEKLGIMGGSNGGLLVGACMTQRPDLFKVAIPFVGVMDMLRYHKFTIGWAWASDYGTSEDNAEMFNYLYGYSPLHNIKEGVAYPATLAFTADHDDRVVPAHTFKFMATLQEKHGGDNPVLIRIETKAGHGAGKPTSKRIDEAADMWAFVFQNFGMKPKF